MKRIYIKTNDKELSKFIQETCFKNGVVWGCNGSQVRDYTNIGYDEEENLLFNLNNGRSNYRLVSYDEFLATIKRSGNSIHEVINNLPDECNEFKQSIKIVVDSLIKIYNLKPKES